MSFAICFNLDQSNILVFGVWLIKDIYIHRGGQESQLAACSILFETYKRDPHLFAVCKDHRLRVWSCKVSCFICPQVITRRQNFRLVQIETNCRRHFKVHLKWKISTM